MEYVRCVPLMTVAKREGGRGGGGGGRAHDSRLRFALFPFLQLVSGC